MSMQSARSRAWQSWWRLALLLLGIGACIGIIPLLDPAFGTSEEAIEPASAWIADIARNALPVLLAWLVVLAVSGRGLFSIALTLTVTWLLYGIDALKREHLDTPLLPADAAMLPTLFGHSGQLLVRYVPGGVSIAFLLVVAGFVLLFWWERPRRRRSITAAPRVVLLLASTAAFSSLLGGYRPWPGAYEPMTDEFKTWSPLEQAQADGLLAHLLRFHWRMNEALPIADPIAAAHLIDRHVDALVESTSPTPPPDIVILQAESFFDAARVQGIEDADVLPRFRELGMQSKHGNLFVPTFGGGTIRTEFEVLTGIGMRYFPDTEYPYFRLTATPLRSLATTFAREGYRTIALHPNDRNFWNRASAFANLGIDEFLAIEHFGDAERDGYYVSDDALIDRIIEQLDSAEEPVFLFAISMENHGPYDDYPALDPQRRRAQPVPAGLDARATREWQGFLYHADNADRALGRLADALRDRSRRTLLLFYGDHLPSLPAVYAQLRFDDERSPQQQPVPWLLFDSASRNSQPNLDTAAFYLPALLVDAAGIRSPWFDLLESVRRADLVKGAWTPLEDHGLGAVMRLRQQRGFRHMVEERVPSMEIPGDPGRGHGPP